MTEVKTNYKSKYKDYNCVACEKNNTFVEETQEPMYGSVSSGRELALGYVTFSKSLDGCCDEM